MWGHLGNIFSPTGLGAVYLNNRHVSSVLGAVVLQGWFLITPDSGIRFFQRWVMLPHPGVRGWSLPGALMLPSFLTAPLSRPPSKQWPFRGKKLPTGKLGPPLEDPSLLSRANYDPPLE